MRSIAALVLALPKLALAQPADIPPAGAPAPAATAPEAQIDFGHLHQFYARFTFGTGYRFIVPYEDDAICGPNGDTSPCESRMPAFMDSDVGFGAAAGVELSVMLRLGLEYEDLNHSYPLVFGPGIRLYPSASSRVKIFLGFRVLIDFTKVGPQRPGEPSADEKTDLALRGEPGLQVEITRNVGVYLQGGVQFGALRWFQFEADGGLGFQVRFP
jgi:hypothetical protein